MNPSRLVFSSLMYVSKCSSYIRLYYVIVILIKMYLIIHGKHICETQEK